MKKVDVLVIGGSAGGIPAAISCRRRYPEKNVHLFRKEAQVQVPCGLPYIFGTLGSPEKNIIPDAMLENNGIEFTIGEVERIDRDKKTLLLAGGNTIGYDRLIVATGSSPVVLPIPGIEKKNVFMAKKDTTYLKKMLDAINAAKDIVIIGGGFIGVELADECKKNHNCNVTIVEMLPHCLQLAIDEEFCNEAETILTDRGIKLLTSSRVEAILGDKQVSGIKLSDGKELKADVIIISIGVKPNIKLAKVAGLEIGPAKAIAVDRYMRTTDEYIFACGDCCEKHSFFSGKSSIIMLASVAGAEGRIAGANLFNTHCYNRGEIGVFSTIVGERAFGCAGLTEAAARREGYDIVTGDVTAPDRHPGGMPGAVETKVKLVFSKDDGLLLGGGVSGGTSTCEIVNVISACIQARMTAHECSLFQMGTHPALTASPMVYQFVNAAELAVKKTKAK